MQTIFISVNSGNTNGDNMESFEEALRILCQIYNLKCTIDNEITGNTTQT